MTEINKIIEKLFPGREIPPEFTSIFSGLTFSESELLKASPAKLSSPFSLSGLGQMLEGLIHDFEAGQTIHVRNVNSPDSIVAVSLLKRIFKKHRKLIRPASGDNNSDPANLPFLDLGDPDGVHYRRSVSSGDESIIFLPAAFEDSGRYAVTGSVFKLGQARQISREKDFNREYVAFDLETSGKNYRSDEIIEIGAVKIKNGELGDEYSALIKPSRPITAEISKLTGITNDNLMDAPPLEEVLPSFLDFVGDGTLVAHNIDFDFTFLNNACRRVLKKRLTNETYDTLTQARARMPGQSHRLGAVAQQLGIELKNWHRATADAKAAALIFLHFMEEDHAPRRYAYFQAAVSWACLGTLTARVPLTGDNAIFFRYGLPALLDAFPSGEKYLRKHPERSPIPNRRLLDELSSWRRKRRSRAIYRILELSFAT